MFSPKISAIAAIGAHNREMGSKNKNMWKIAEDKDWYEAKTTGHVIIMGRNTYEHIGKIPQPNKTNIVITSQTNLDTPGFIFVTSIEKALDVAREIEEKEVFFVGGSQIYTLSLPFLDRLYLTLIEGQWPQADVFFPEYGVFSHEVYREDIDETEKGGYRYSFTIKER
jgi:dihydrofolate reductase